MINNFSKNDSFFGHCKRHLMTDDKSLIRFALNPINKFGVGSSFYFTEMDKMKEYLISNMLQEPLYSEIALWLAEGSESCVFYIEDPNCGIAFSKRNHDWSKGPLVCDQAVILLRKKSKAKYDFIIETAYPIPDIWDEPKYLNT